MSPSFLLNFAATCAQTRLEQDIAQAWHELSKTGDTDLFTARQFAKACLRYRIGLALKDAGATQAVSK